MHRWNLLLWRKGCVVFSPFIGGDDLIGVVVLVSVDRELYGIGMLVLVAVGRCLCIICSGLAHYRYVLV